jgi:hypothetical protein
VLDWAQAHYYSSAAGGSDLFKGFYGEAKHYAGTHAATDKFSFVSGTTPVGQSSLSNGAQGGVRGDLNGDGIDDVNFVGISANDGFFGGNPLYVFFGTSQKMTYQSTDLRSVVDGTNGFYVAHDNYLSTLKGYAPQDAGDVNGDGVDDLVLLGGGNPLTVIFGKKTPYAQPTYPTIQDVGSEAAFFDTDQVRSARVGDLNKDGIADIVFISENKLRVVWGKQGLTGKPIFGTQYPEVGEIDIDPASGLDQVSVVDDIDGDLTNDIVILSRTWNGSTGGALILFGKTITFFLGGPNLDPLIPH